MSKRIRAALVLLPLFPVLGCADGGPRGFRRPRPGRSGLFLAAAAAILAISACSEQQPVAPELEPELSIHAAARHIPGHFIVTLRPGANPRAVAAEHAINPRYVYTTVLNGFAGKMSDAARAGLLRDNRVARVEPDGWVYPTSLTHTSATSVQQGATWGLDRIDQQSLPLNGEYHYDGTGSGVTVYVIDSGIRFTHSEFGGRATNGHDFVLDDDPDNTLAGQEPGEDCNGHGTHVAGTIGGATYGVAKGVDLVSVRVFGCSGGSPWSRTIAAFDWVTQHHNDGGATGSVVNMSFGGWHGADDAEAVLDALHAMISAGISAVAAAGNVSRYTNPDGDACQQIPAKSPLAMTIGATDMNDWQTTWSGRGDCVDWYAPGQDITSAWWESDVAVIELNGTSMAAPHTSGVAALFLQANPGASPEHVFHELREGTTKGVVVEQVPVYAGNSGNIKGYEAGDVVGDLLYSRLGEVTLPATGSITGTVSAVTDGEQVPIEDATVRIDGTLLSAITDVKGAYSFVTRNGYYPAEGTATVQEAQTTVLDFQLAARENHGPYIVTFEATSSRQRGGVYAIIVNWEVGHDENLLQSVKTEVFQDGTLVKSEISEVEGGEGSGTHEILTTRRPPFVVRLTVTDQEGKTAVEEKHGI
jgi:subtilisin family serine protease